jgi:hypothetical protein
MKAYLEWGSLRNKDSIDCSAMEVKRPVTPDEIREQFKTEDTRLLRIVLGAVKWLEPFGFRPTSTPTRYGRPGGTVKFVPKGGGPMLCSLQFHGTGKPFLYFKWTKKTMQRLGVAEDLRKCLFDEILNIIHGGGEKEGVLTEWRLFLEPCDETHLPKIKEILTPLIQRIAVTLTRV